MALYNEERPHKFADVKGQEKVIKVLQKDLQKKQLKNAYLFSGVRGTGKTTVARIMAMAVNCEHPDADGSPCCECAACREVLEQSSIDVFELDAASNNSVDNVREILEKVQYKPIRRRKVFILDECHMLSNAACNALLKVLEEPPKDVTFILCTTEFHKVLPTIKSRCSCFDFEKIPLEVIQNHLKGICERRHLAYEEKALLIIAKAANGALRDALSILDKFIAIEDITADTVIDMLGMATDDVIFRIINAIVEERALDAADAIKGISASGGSLSFVIEEIYKVLLDVVAFQSTGDEGGIVGSGDYVNNVVALSYPLSTEKAFRIMNEFRSVYQLRNADGEFAMVSACIALIYEDTILETLDRRVGELENAVKNGICSTKSAAEPVPMQKEDALSSIEVKGECVDVTDLTTSVNETAPSSLPEEIPTGFTNCEGDVPFTEGSLDSLNQEQADVSSTDTVPATGTESNNELEQKVFEAAESGMSFDELRELINESGEETVSETTSRSTSLEETAEASDESITELPDLSDDYARFFGGF